MGLIFWLFFGFVQLSIQFEINITKFDNCFDDLPIEIQEVHYEYNDDGYIDHIHGQYLVRTVDTRDKELITMVYKCPIDDPQPCENKIHHISTDLHCDKFRNDDSGIWHLVAQAMGGSTCGHETGLFDFAIPRINRDYFEKYLMGDEKTARYRMILMFHKMSEESSDERACAEIHFDIFH